MKNIFKIITLIFILFQFWGCTEENIVNNYNERKSLVVVSDFSPSSDLLIKILGQVTSKYPNFDVRFIQVKAFDFIEASYMFDLAAQTLPKGTYLVGIVDPSVEVKKYVYVADGKYIMAPDNGLSSRILYRTKADSMYFAENPELIGGDIQENLSYEEFYVSTVLSFISNIPLNKFGSAVANPVKFDIQIPKFENDTLTGEIMFTDNFGNCVTNIADTLLKNFVEGSYLKIETGSTSFFAKFGVNYSSVPTGLNVVFENSTKRLEMSVNMDNLSERYSLSAGAKLKITKAKPRIGILKYSDIEVSNSVVEQIKSQLKIYGFNENESVEFIERNADGQASLLPNLLKEMLDEGIDLLVPVSTPAAQTAIFNTPETIPIVFTFVTNPESAGILNKRSKVTGCSDATNFYDYLQFVKRLLPDLHKAGRIYNDNEANSLYAQQQLLALAPYNNIELVTEIANSTEEIPVAYQSIKNQLIEAILIAADNTMSKGIQSLSELAINDKVVIIGDSNEYTEKGALASIAVDYEALSKSSGDLIYAILLGKNPDSEAIKKFNTNTISVNKTTAQKINFTIPQDILDEADFIYE